MFRCELLRVSEMAGAHAVVIVSKDNSVQGMTGTLSEGVRAVPVVMMGRDNAKEVTTISTNLRQVTP